MILLRYLHACVRRVLVTAMALIILLAAVPANSQTQKIAPSKAPAKAESAPPKAESTAVKVECSTCHQIAEKVPEGGSKHPAVDMGCDSCHVQHDESATVDPKNPRHLKKTVPALCADCHDFKDKQLAVKHKGQPFAQANCVSCHSPHMGDGPKLTYRFSHPPFAAGDCDSCHQAPKGGKVALNEGGKQELCFTCHSEIKERLEKSKVRHGLFAVSDKSCTTCHSPHTSPNPAHLKQQQVAMCESCHAEREQEHKTEKFLHKPVFQDGCSTCHEPHGSNNTAHLRADVNQLCLTCHAQKAAGESGSDEKTLVLFGGAVKLPGNYLSEVARIELTSSGKGHPLGNHPATAADPKNPGKPTTCVTCHDPHATKESPALLVTQKRSSSLLCIKCHG